MLKTIVHLHGFASSSRSTKAVYLREHLNTLAAVDFHAFDMNPTPIDFKYMTTTGAINRLRQYILDRQLESVNLTASSFGSLLAVHYAHRFGGVERLFLLAPLLAWDLDWLTRPEVNRWRETGTILLPHRSFLPEAPLDFGFFEDGRHYRETVPPAAPTLILHGRHDETISIRFSRAYADEHPDQVRLVELDAGHNLNEHLSEIGRQVRAFILDI